MRDWRKVSLRDFLRRLLVLGDSPHGTALAFAVGVFLGFSPFWGLHTTLGLVAAFVFRLNRVAVLVGVFVNSPWTMAPVGTAGTALGLWMLGAEPRLPDIGDTSVLSRGFWSPVLSGLEAWALPFFLGNTVLAVAAALAAYIVLRWILRRNARRFLTV